MHVPCTRVINDSKLPGDFTFFFLLLIPTAVVFARFTKCQRRRSRRRVLRLRRVLARYTRFTSLRHEGRIRGGRFTRRPSLVVF